MLMVLASIGAMAGEYVSHSFEVGKCDGQRVIIKADTVSSYITLPRGTAAVMNDYGFNDSVIRLFGILEKNGCELIRATVSGSASPDGLWGNNIALSKARMDNAAEYLRKTMGVPAHKIERQDLMEDWKRLEEMVSSSDLPYKEEVLRIIRTKTWGERKTALRQLDGGSVWNILEEYFFPLLRCVKVTLLYKGNIRQEETCCPKEERVTVTDTIYVRDTVYLMKEPVPEVNVPVEETYTYEDCGRRLHTSPWMMGFKTNLLSDAVAIPSVGMEIQLARHLSLDIAGWGTEYNLFVPEDESASFYGVAPELRWWFGDRTMMKGSYLGVHGSVAWYTLEWRNGILYQNGPKDVWEDGYHDAGNSDPVWSAGITYGYSLGLGRKARWGLEFYIGAGYMSIRQNTASRNSLGLWQLKEHQSIDGFGITKAGINLTYRFSLRRWEPEVRFAY